MHDLDWIIAIGAALGAVLYIGRELRRLVHAVNMLLAVPAQHRELAAQTAENTRAIADLTSAVRRLTDAETAVTPRPRGRHAGAVRT